MQQSSATQSLHLSFLGLLKIVACSHSSSQCLLVSTVFGTVSSLHPTSFLYLYTENHSQTMTGIIRYLTSTFVHVKAFPIYGGICVSVHKIIESLPTL